MLCNILRWNAFEVFYIPADMLGSDFGTACGMYLELLGKARGANFAPSPGHKEIGGRLTANANEVFK